LEERAADAEAWGRPACSTGGTNMHGWPHDIHPDTAEALEHVDAAMFTGDPAETRPRFERMKFYIERWAREIKVAEERLLENEREASR